MTIQWPKNFGSVLQSGQTFELFSVLVWLAPAADSSANAWEDTWGMLGNMVNKSLTNFYEMFVAAYNNNNNKSVE